VVADLRPLKCEVGLGGHLEVDVAVLAARGRDARRGCLVVARAAVSMTPGRTEPLRAQAWLAPARNNATACAPPVPA
jgi:hypothetical protein